MNLESRKRKWQKMKEVKSEKQIKILKLTFFGGFQWTIKTFAEMSNNWSLKIINKDN
jgi:hypothetical protein